MTFYRKYRPQTVAELDLVSVRQAFGRILSSGTFSQAYLFAGPKGTGKTSSARILAKIVNCKRNALHASRSTLLEPCNECDSCRSIMNGSSLTVMEIDAASNRGIDDIRLLRERVALAPGHSLYAVYVIDEVHMLTNEAFNALLKTLEEPPQHAIFALCTTETHKVPETIVSRCTTVMFTKASPSEIVGSLEKAVKGESLVVAEGALELLASSVDGSFRDAMKYLEQLSQKQSEITLSDVQEVMGYGTLYNPTTLIEALRAKQVEVGLADIASKVSAGSDMSLFSKRVVEVLREQLLVEVQASPRNEAAIQELIELTQKASDAALAIKTALVPSLPLELLVVEWGLAHKDTSNPLTLKLPRASKKPSYAEATVGKQETASTNETNEIENERLIDMQEVQEKWQQIMKGVRPLNHSLEALLRAARPLDCEQNVLKIEVFYTFHKEQLEQARHLTILEQVVTQIFNTRVKLAFVLGSKIKRAMAQSGMDVSNVTGAVEDEHMAEAVEEIFGK